MSRGKVETISRLARWSAGGVDSLGPWSSSNTAGWSLCCSDPFKIGNWEWSIAFEKKDEQLLYGLLFKSPGVSEEHPVLARVAFRLFATESVHSPYNSPVFEEKFHSNHCFWPTESTPHSCLILDSILHGSFVFDVEFLHLKISGEGLVQSLPPKPTMSCLSRMLNEQILTDITINTAGGALKAHRAVLSAKSPVFKSMFSHYDSENQTYMVDMEDMSLESCTVLLNCLYGNIDQEEFSKNRLQLLVAAEKYGMADLKNSCEEGLIEDINSNNVLERLQAARIYQLDTLKKVCMEFLIDFGMIYKVRKEIKSFFRDEYKEVILEMVREMTITEKPAYD